MASFTNMATLSYNGSQINSNVVTGELRDALTITKTAVSGGYRPGDTVTYVVTLSNTGTAALTGLTLTDDLGGSTVAAGTVYPLAYVPGSVLYYNGGTVQPAPTVTAGPPMTWCIRPGSRSLPRRGWRARSGTPSPPAAAVWPRR